MLVNVVWDGKYHGSRARVNDGTYCKVAVVVSRMPGNIQKYTHEFSCGDFFKFKQDVSYPIFRVINEMNRALGHLCAHIG